MQYRFMPWLIALVVATGGCTSSGTAATAPSTTESEPPSTTTDSPGTTSTTMTTTTIDRTAEIRVIFEDLEHRRLEAIYTGNTEAFLDLFADTPYRERSLEVFDFVEPGPVPEVTIEIIDVLRDDGECLAIYYRAEASGTGEESQPATVVLSKTADGRYEYAFTNEGKGGWLCDGPHPLSG